MTMPTSFSRRQQGFSLVELLVSLAIGLVVLAAVLVSYVGSGAAGRNTSAIAQMTEDASVALNLMRNHIAMADYSAPTGTGPSGMTKAYSSRAIFGCNGGAFTADTSLSLDALTTALNCASTGADAVGIVYQADASNAVMVGTPLTPSDCLGQALAPTGGIYLADNRFYVSAGSLFCQGSGNRSNARALVENIHDLQVSYGIGGTGATAKQVAYYANANAALEWDKVLTVRLCVVVKSAEPVANGGVAYRDCSFTEQTPADRHLYRAFTSTVVLHNRVGAM
jgi:type IV pilus assembly protein PilW